jgi:hypothetical protein
MRVHETWRCITLFHQYQFRDSLALSTIHTFSFPSARLYFKKYFRHHRKYNQFIFLKIRNFMKYNYNTVIVKYTTGDQIFLSSLM